MLVVEEEENIWTGTGKEKEMGQVVREEHFHHRNFQKRRLVC